MSKTNTRTRQSLFDAREVRQMKKEPLPLKVRLVLPLLANRYAYEDRLWIRYKEYKGVLYILGTKEL